MNDPRTDAQTGLPNRRAFYEELHRRLAQLQRFGTRLCVLLLRVDKLDGILTDHGRGTGELVMRSYSQFLRADVRDMDLVARYDSDTFGIMLPATELVYAAGVGGRIRGNVASHPMQLSGCSLPLTISVGVAEAQQGDDETVLLGRAAAALETSSASSGRTVYFHTGLSIEPLPTSVGAGM